MKQSKRKLKNLFLIILNALLILYFPLAAYMATACPEAFDNSPVSKSYFEEGKHFFDQRYYYSAIINFDKAIAYNNKNDQAYLFRGLSKLYMDSHESALRDLNAAIKAAPPHSLPQLYVFRGIIKGSQNHYRGSITDLNHAIHLKPENTLAYQAYTMRGIMKGMRGNFTEAVKDFGQAIKIKKDSASTAYLMRGIVYFANNKFKKAFNDFSQAIKLNPSHPGGYLFRSRAIFRMTDSHLLGGMKAAQKDDDMAYNISPDYVMAYRDYIYDTQNLFQQYAEHEILQPNIIEDKIKKMLIMATLRR